MFLLRMALLNIGRNRRRSVVTVLAVGVGLGTLIFLWGFCDGTTEDQRENAIRLFTGHIQIHAQGFDETLAPELSLPRREEILDKIKNRIPGITVTERVKSEALIGTSEKSRGVLLMGIDPLREPKVTDLQNHLEKGEFLSPQGNRELLVGYRLAKRLHLEPGGKVVVMTQAVDGTLAGFAYRIRGIFHTGSQQVDELSAYMTLASLQELLGLEGQVHEIVIRLENRKAIPKTLAALEPLLDSKIYEVLTWNQIVPEVEQWTQWAESIVGTLLIAVMIVIGTSVMNTVLMSVFERTRELGVMMAVGTSPRQIVQLIFVETVILELLGIAFGLAAGYLVTFYFGKAGIAFHNLEEAFSMGYGSTTVYTRVNPKHVLQSILTLLGMTSFIGLYPAWRAGRMEPVKAIYHS